MAIVKPSSPPEVLTFEQYMAEGEINRRYDIIDGVRIFMPGPTWKHQRIADKITRSLLAYEEKSGVGMAFSAPFDILIRRVPKLQTRQPDVFFITHQTLTRGGGIPEKGVLQVAPELVVEILSDSETERRVGDKLTDYISIGVKEAWLVRPETRTVEVLRLTPNGPVSAATYDQTQTLQSLTFPDLTVAVADFFK
ncbi:MAG TPA: Uma2 family endonuclease [Chthonomonadaceae bacterium]|nr:Uma2 family endonuclease [Chthonomonadaceae bacterium]